MNKKCSKCGEVKSIDDFHKSKIYKDGHKSQCAICLNEYSRKHRANNQEKYREYERKNRSKERGFLKKQFRSILRRAGVKKDEKHQCYFTYEEFDNAFQKHKERHGMKSAWGPPHLEITTIHQLIEGAGHGCKNRGLKQIHSKSNLSADRLDSSKPYTIQNLIFIRADENNRKKDTSYEDCKIQMRLHEERFIEMKVI